MPGDTELILSLENSLLKPETCMSARNFFAKHQKVMVHYVLPAIGSLSALGVVWFVTSGSSSSRSEIELTNNETLPAVTEEASPVQGALAVYVAGAVARPGVYKLSVGSLIVDAITAAGGLSKQCDQSATEQSLNLAQEITDGMKIYIPKKGEATASAQLSAPDTSSSSSEASSTGRTSINNASKGELMDLYGIGEVYSQKIIDNRPYTSVEELVSKDVIPNATYEKIMDEISL